MSNETITTKILQTLRPEDAAAMFVARNSKGLTAEEEQLLAGWLETDVAHRKEYENAERVWQTFVNIRGDEIASAMRAHAAAERKKKSRSKIRYVIAGVVFVLAAVAAFVFTPALNFWKGDAAAKGTLAITVVPFSTLRGEIRDEQWPDGSHSHLDADTIVVGRFGPVGRHVQLQRGRALFTVAADRARSFTVSAGDWSIVAVGTKFDVNYLNGGVIVTLLEGHVVIESKQAGVAPVMLAAGQQYVAGTGAGVLRTLDDGGVKATAWRTRTINFNGEMLADAVAIMNRYTQEQFVIKDPTVGALRFAGEFRAGDTAAFSAALAQQLQLDSLRKGNEIELVHKATSDIQPPPAA